MATLDGSILNVALPTISSYLNCPVDVVAWVVLAYSLTLISLMLVFGVWAGKRGYSFAYRFGYGFFIIGSIVCAISNSIYILILGRIIQSIGTAMFSAVGPGMVTQVFPAQERGKGIGLMVMMVSAGFMVGPPLGGFLLDIWQWQSIFIINIPIGLIGLYLTLKYFNSFTTPKSKQRLKLKGAVSISFALFSGILTLSLLNDYPMDDIRIWGLAIFSLLAFISFIKFEADPKTAMIGIHIFKNRQFTTSIAAMLFMFISISGVLILIPFYLEQVKHFEPKQVGLYLIILPILLFIFAPISGRLSDKIGFRLLTSIGIITLITGLLLLSELEAVSANSYIVFSLIMVGMGVGIFNTPNSSALMGSVSEELRAVTSGILATTRNIGMSIGVALSTTLFTFFQLKFTYLNNDDQVFILSYHYVILISVGFAILTLPFCLFRKN